MKIIGHAGAAGLAPENTIAAFKKAIEYQVDAIEFDVRVSKDNVPILHHNPYLIDPSGKRLRISEETLRSLRQHKTDLATLEGAIRVINHAAPLHIELKPGVAAQPIIAVIQQLLDSNWKTSEFVFASFDVRLLLAFHNAFPDCEIIVIDSWSSVRATHRAHQLGTKRLAMNQRWLWRPFIRAMTRRGYELSAYTVNTPRQARLLESAGLSGIITDYPDRFHPKRKP